MRVDSYRRISTENALAMTDQLLERSRLIVADRPNRGNFRFASTNRPISNYCPRSGDQARAGVVHLRFNSVLG
jgi:hypothetical protein